jgi:2-hydroxy-6-oxonona-2,4-dienedioate hydrolase
LVCGLGVSSSYMTPAALELMKDADIYCPDLPGFGQSSKPQKTLNVPELAHYLAAFLEKSEINRAVVISHSFGCQIAADFALKYPEKLERLVLAAPTGNPQIKSSLRYFGRLILDVPREPFSLIPIAIRDYLKAGFIRGYQTLKFSLQDSFEEKLPQIKIPTLVICGSSDPIVSRQWVEKITKILPNGKLACIKGAAHAVNYNSPESFASVIREFLES